ncbi:hypothetical protein GUJ93_ZPchr0003g17926 [Zizania palustris]|uniref:glucose-1-phosphate adenylyltransferase n=1 Tax=Zizania palustris TaxID=103762 RepID=A0A8J5SBA4_ZIZPA|nr:hypothetical protein GUJ93_ZPchr0003g17926 [Zizania palustris]
MADVRPFTSLRLLAMVVGLPTDWSAINFCTSSPGADSGPPGRGSIPRGTTFSLAARGIAKPPSTVSAFDGLEWEPRISNSCAPAFLFNDYWGDIGTIKSFEANLALAEQSPRFSFYDAHKPMYTSRRNLPPSMVNNNH